MGRTRWLAFILALAVLTGSLSSASAQRPDPHHGASKSESSSTPESSGGSDCDLIIEYADGLWIAIEDSGPFMSFLYSDQTFGDISADEAKDIIASAEELISEIQTLDVPAAYATGHDGIIEFFQINSDIARFYALDSSIVPDMMAYDESLAVINDGETALLAACPEEMDVAGGYIMFDPSLTEDNGDN